MEIVRASTGAAPAMAHAALSDRPRIRKEDEGMFGRAPTQQQKTASPHRGARKRRSAVTGGAKNLQVDERSRIDEAPFNSSIILYDDYRCGLKINFVPP